MKSLIRAAVAMLFAAAMGILASWPSFAQTDDPLAPTNQNKQARLEDFLGNGKHPPVTIDVVLGYASLATIATLLHEVGHALIDQYHIPITGSEEDAADEFAAIVLIHNAEAEPAHHETLAAMVRFFLDRWQRFGPEFITGVSAAYWDVHSPDRKRAYNVLCLMVGAFPDRYGQVLRAQTDSDQEYAATLQSCTEQYKRKAETWDRLLADAMKPVQSAPAPDQPRFTLSFVPAHTPLGRFFEALNESQPILPSLVDWLNSVFALPPGTGNIPIIVGECGVGNAVYSSTEKGIAYCYELVGDFARWFIETETGAKLKTFDALADWFSRQEATEAIAALAGAWTAQGTSDAGRRLSLSYRFNTDETFHQVEGDGVGQLVVDGTFSVDAPLLEPVVVTMHDRAWTFCRDVKGADCPDADVPEVRTLKVGPWSRDAVVIDGKTYTRDPNPPPPPIFGRWQGQIYEFGKTPLLPDVKVTFEPDMHFVWSGKWLESGDCEIDVSGTFTLEGDALTLQATSLAPASPDSGCQADGLPRRGTFHITKLDDQSLNLGKLEFQREGSALLKFAPSQ